MNGIFRGAQRRLSSEGKKKERDGVRWQPIKTEQETVEERKEEGGGVLTCATNLSGAL